MKGKEGGGNCLYFEGLAVKKCRDIFFLSENFRPKVQNLGLAIHGFRKIYGQNGNFEHSSSVLTHDVGVHKSANEIHSVLLSQIFAAAAYQRLYFPP